MALLDEKTRRRLQSGGERYEDKRIRIPCCWQVACLQSKQSGRGWTRTCQKCGKEWWILKRENGKVHFKSSGRNNHSPKFTLG